MKLAMQWWNKQKLKGYYAMLDAIRAYDCAAESDDALAERSDRLRCLARAGAALDELLPEAYALAAEAVRRALGVKLYEVQLIAAMALYDGKLVEMATGEGKTLAAVLPAYLHALPGKGVHVLTYNDYLAERDAGWTRPVYRLLGVSVGYVRQQMPPDARKAAYNADITYVTAKEAGFDFLRDSLCYEPEELVHRGFHMAIVDEADSLLIDEARVPLVIAGEQPASGEGLEQARQLVAAMQAHEHYAADEHGRNVFMTDAGVDFAEARLGCGNLYDEANTALLTRIHCALHAEMLLKRDVHYIVRDGKVELVDELTGRVADNRHWPDGLQAAVETKEGVPMHAEGRILGTLTLQHYMRGYGRLCGMTATAASSADEFLEVYGLDIAVIPPNKPCRRVDAPPLVYATSGQKRDAIVEEVSAAHAAGRPVLIGTGSVEESEQLSAMLLERGIACQVLNARNDEMEAGIIAQAGALGAVTVSTNMAGRGVDIVLGAGKQGQYEQVAELGGLYVIGTNMHESVRIDNQLKGRAGRQGDPGLSRFIISGEDGLMKQFGIRDKRTADDGRAANIKKIAQAQRIADGQNREIRKTVARYADMIEQQRQIMQQWRTDIMLRRQPAAILQRLDEALYNKLKDRLGEPKLARMERFVALYEADQCWADYLAHVAYIREGIHLESLSNRDPLHVFHSHIIDAYERLFERIHRKIAAAFRKVDAAGGLLDTETAGLTRPSSTWTYIINDQFFQKTKKLLFWKHTT